MPKLMIALLLMVPGLALADADRMTVNGHSVEINDGTQGGKMLFVDGQVMHANGLILLDAALLEVAGVPVVTGISGAGGNVCNAAPFVVVLPDGAAPEFYGPIDSCANLQIVDVQPEAIVFASEPVPSQPGEVWVWNRITGMTEALPEEFAPTEGAGWDQLSDLAEAHPADAMALEPVYQALVSGLGADYPIYAERISGLGSGDLTAEGYLGEACEKYTCEADFAVLYLHKATRQVFAIWHVSGEIENRIYPEDTSLWPPEAMVVLREKAAAGD
ncbi:hypothetical protein [Tabrizicola sp.]|uniref:hypothetical protein n=1 Tax=Tabrizicola sp. TaxID=2005166 RepID=UPI00286A6436|nr:hypothetical protein [Tabrizicola sp.]